MDLQIFSLFFPTKEPFQLTIASFTVSGKTHWAPNRPRTIPHNTLATVQWIITVLLILQGTMRDENLRMLIVEYVNLIVVGYWVREGVFFCTLFSTFCLFYLYMTCILLHSFHAFFNTISYLSKKYLYSLSPYFGQTITLFFTFLLRSKGALSP